MAMNVGPATAPSAYRGRFAPSPTGPLHPGSLVAAFGSWLHARHAGGRWLVRIEDVDPPREVPGAARLQLQALDAFGLRADGEIVRQSARGDAYRAALDRLLDSGHAFVCHCSRADILATGGVHRACVPGARRPDPAIRFRVPDGATVRFVDGIHGPFEQHVDTDVGDFVLRRAEGYWAYQLAVVVDDAAQSISDVVRGADLLDSTPRQLLLQRALDLPPPRYAHLPLVVDAAGRKFSKSSAALPIDSANPIPSLRAAWAVLGQPAGAVANASTLDAFLGASVEAFDPALIPRGRSVLPDALATSA
jgi:glutamyl-Q tRNA(Asp) synthetase